MDTLDVAGQLQVPMSQIDIRAIRSQGAGGQNVNKLATAIHLRFDSQQSDALPDFVKQRLLELSDRRISEDGVVTIKSQAYRSQARNRKAALTRLAEILATTLRTRKRRIKTRPGRKSKEARLAAKQHRSRLKSLRGRVLDD